MAKEKQEKKTTEKVLPRDIVSEMQESYLDYSMSVITNRALPDVRDGLKPVQRRILFVMHELGLGHTAKPRKCAKIAGDTSGNYHPHGETNVYGALVNLAQNFYMRYPLVLGQGNFGSIDGDPPAAMRYTEAKLSAIAGDILRDLEKETVDWRPNYDNVRKEPVVLSAAVPNLILNGVTGIAVGMATKIPPHNLREVMDALIYLVDHPDAAGEDLLKFIKGPDFPTGGLVFSEQDIHHACATGRGGVVIRGETEIIENKNGVFQIIITSIPYQVNKADLIVKLADLVREKKIEGIKDIREESTTLSDIRIVIDLKSGAHPQKILNAIYKHTELETAFHYNVLALVDGVPRLLTIKGLLENFLAFRFEVVTRRTRFELKRAEERVHILLGLKTALDNIDAVIKTIKRSKDTETACTNLMKSFRLTEIQARAILEMKLSRLASLEVQKIKDELAEKQSLVKELKALLADSKKIYGVIRKEFEEIKAKHGDDRRTKIIKHGVKEISTEDLVPEKENVLILTAGGYVKRIDPSEYRAQHRGGVGVADHLKEEDFVNIVLTANTHSDLLFWSDRGKVYQIKMYDLPEGKRQSRGKSIMNFLPLAPEERITSILEVPKKQVKVSLVMVTRKGVAKKVSLESFHDVRRSGIIAIKLGVGDALLAVRLVDKMSELIIVSEKGQAIRSKTNDYREMGRNATGVKAIRLAPPRRGEAAGDSVVAADVISPEAARAGALVVLSENGYGKRSKLTEYKVQRRGGFGISTANITPKIGKIIDAKVVSNGEEEIVAISKQGQVVRTGLNQIPVLGRRTQGVRVMKLRAGDRVASSTFV